jgi:hypothetical protein
VTADELDAWLPHPVIRSRHRREARATPEALWAAAQAVRLDETRALGRLVRWRLPGVRPETTYRELFAAYPFCSLHEAECASVSGLAGRIWTLSRDYPALADPDAFRRWAEPGTVRVLMAHWAEPAGEGRAALCSEARVAPTSPSAQLPLRALWALIGRFERLIALEPLALAGRRAEAEAEAAAARSRA